MPDFSLTLLSDENVEGSNAFEVLKKYGLKASTTDFNILTGSSGNGIRNNYKALDGDYTCDYWLKGPTSSKTGDIALSINYHGYMHIVGRWEIETSIRPVIKSDEIFDILLPTAKEISDGIYEVEFGEYPQTIAKNGEKLEALYADKKLPKTGKKYTYLSGKKTSQGHASHDPVDLCEFQDETGKKYVRIESKTLWTAYDFELSDGTKIKDIDEREAYWIEVQPIKWLIDEKRVLISKKCLATTPFDRDKKFYGDFETTQIKEFMDKYMAKEMFSKESLLDIKIKSENMPQPKIKNYGFDFSKPNEKEMITDLLESDIPVFLHGKSSDGKSARVKQIDPDCVILYLRNATPDSLNGKSVYDQQNGKMIDIKPTWLVKLETLCENEPDKIHILFLDELTNALPSIQGMAFNIVLDREVNGLWKLPSNARIVAAGNELEDSLAANELAEPLFNRFAHIYIETKVANWLMWAYKNNIHPLICTFIAYKGVKALRTQYDGIKPNADPRKWEMASKVLYNNGNINLLESLIGEKLTKELIDFCEQSVVSLEDVLNDRYPIGKISSLKEKYATVAALLQVDEANVSKVREFLEPVDRMLPLFDNLWIGNSEERLSILIEIDNASIDFAKEITRRTR